MPLTGNDIHFFQISENAISLEFGGDINEATLDRISILNQCIKQNPFSGLLSTIPAYTTLTVYFNSIELMSDGKAKGLTALDKISAYINAINVDIKNNQQTLNQIIHIPVCYEATFGFDLEELSSFYQIKKEEIIELHSSAVYTVYMIGFVPGFPYLGGLSEKLTAPRKQNPRLAIPAGSVGIAGKQTGIYPLETPGGWQIIGRTPFKLFDVNRHQPSLLKAGDKINFESISLAEFKKIEREQ